MSLKGVYDKLADRRKDVFKHLDAYSKQEEYNPFNQLISFNEKEKDLEFTVGDYQFVIITQANLTIRSLSVHTYELIYAIGEYPKRTTVHVNTLDIKVDTGGYMCFTSAPGNVEVDENRLGYSYFIRLRTYLEEKEKAINTQ